MRGIDGPCETVFLIWKLRVTAGERSAPRLPDAP
jgi:hypothetical protein